jgi:tRNA nucleotidyltransferase/poly(A) polymerase
VSEPADLIIPPPAADELGRVFAASGHVLHLVGGTVRDALLGRDSDDLDFTTDARPEAVLEIAARSPPTGRTGTTGSAATRWSSTATRSATTCGGATSP